MEVMDNVEACQAATCLMYFTMHDGVCIVCYQGCKLSIASSFYLTNFSKYSSHCASEKLDSMPFSTIPLTSTVGLT